MILKKSVFRHSPLAIRQQPIYSAIISSPLIGIPFTAKACENPLQSDVRYPACIYSPPRNPTDQNCGILPLRVRVLFKYSLRTIALQCLRPWPFIFWLIE
jgi:hypothetical protein